MWFYWEARCRWNQLGIWRWNAPKFRIGLKSSDSCPFRKMRGDRGHTRKRPQEEGCKDCSDVIPGPGATDEATRSGKRRTWLFLRAFRGNTLWHLAFWNFDVLNCERIGLCHCKPSGLKQFAPAAKRKLMYTDKHQHPLEIARSHLSFWLKSPCMGS